MSEVNEYGLVRDFLVKSPGSSVIRQELVDHVRLCGGTRESVNKALRTLAKHGFIERGDTTVSITDRAGVVSWLPRSTT